MISTKMRRGSGVAAALAIVFAIAARSADPRALPQRRPDFASDVAPILHSSCAACHRPDQATPFALLSYDDARARGKEIREAVSSRRMPPWSAVAASGYPNLLHDRRLSARQIQTIVSWVDAGMPPGDLSKAPFPPAFPASWQLGLPDLTMSLPRPMSIPPDTMSRTFNVVLYLNFPTDRWLTAIDYQPSSRGLLSHAVVFLAPSTMVIGDEDVLPGFAGLTGAGATGNIAEQMAAVDRSVETIGVWTPTGRLYAAPDSTAVRVPKGSNIVLQFHARAADTGAIEDGTVAMYFSKAPPAVPQASIQVPPSFGIVSGIDLPAGRDRIVVKDELVLPVDIVAIGARGHAHLLGKDLKMTARLPNGSQKGLLWIDRWNVKWQESYYFASPVRLPKGTAIQVEVTYDNSAGNPLNPFTPPQRVVWGPRLADEVGAMDVIIAAPSPADAAALAEARAQHFRNQITRVR